MGSLTQYLKHAVTAVFLLCSGVLPNPGAAQVSDDGSPRLDRLFERLQNTDPSGAKQVEGLIWQEWSRSGSPAMDLLLRRGREAMEAEDYRKAIEHFTALTDHAPLFAEGWNARATAYYQIDHYGPALEDIRRTLTLEPRHFGAISGLALIMEELGYDGLALDAYRMVKTIHPNRENLDDAIARLEAAVEGSTL